MTRRRLVAACLLLVLTRSPCRSQLSRRNIQMINFDCRANGCCDQHEFCRFWSSTGECDNNGPWMRDNCQIACDSCPIGRGRVVPVDCRDQRDLCRFWADIGQCEENSPWMTDNCPVSCNTCDRAGNGQRGDLPPSTQPPPIVEPPVQPTPVPFTRAPPPQQQIVRNPSTGECPFAVTREDNSFRQPLSANSVEDSKARFGCVSAANAADCQRQRCFHLSFRTMDGSCNNFARPTFGAAFTEYLRLRPAAYDNGVDAPVSSFTQTRPSARDATRTLLSSSHQVASAANSLLMQWGQFLSHDLLKTTKLPNADCSTCADVPGKCFNIRTQPNDLRFGPLGCLRMERSAPVCGTGASTARQQYNENTAFIDGSMIYGSSADDARRFRDGLSSLMQTTLTNGRVFPPLDGNQRMQTGDDRANIFIGLAALHTLFVREHNRIASSLQSLNPHWDGDRLFQEARKIVGAELQVITYQEYLPKVIGRATFDNRLGAFRGYDETADASISNVFATAAFRFGHGMIQEFYPRLNENFQEIAQGGVSFDDAVNAPSKLLNEGGVDPVLRGMMATAGKLPQRITPAVTERLFGTTDLSAVNIQRGRDHGLPPYNEWREFCGLRRAANFDELSGEIFDGPTRDALRRSYGNIDNVDVYVGAQLEDPVAGGVVGPTWACLIGEQFGRLRDGDRLFFEAPGAFTPAQLSELRKASLSKVICDSGDRFGAAPLDGFTVTRGDGLTFCGVIPAVDLQRWQE